MYDFASLSPTDFEDLSRDLLQQELQLHLESFKTGRDKGIDLRHSRSTSDDLIIVQCKHWRRSGLSQLKTHLKRTELPKIRRLQPSRYILTTSLELSPTDKNSIRQSLAPFVKSDQDVYGAGDLNGLLTRHADVERRHFKLWLASTEALDRFFNRATLNRSKGLVERVRSRMQLYASNPSFERALEILDKHHVCLIAGEPGIGKTTLADVLLIHHLDQDFDIVEISSDIEEANAIADPQRKQFFYYDDFLGTAFDERLQKNEDARLMSFLNSSTRVPNRRVVLTTREYILNAALLRYEHLATGEEISRKCIVSVADYTPLVRAKILYNHVYFSQLGREARVRLVDGRQYTDVIAHENFSPRLIEHAIRFATNDGITQDFSAFLLETLANPRRLWEHAFHHQLSAHAQSVLLSMLFMPRGAYTADVEVATAALSVARSEGATTHRIFLEQLKILEGTFVTIERAGRGTKLRHLKFATPGLRDYLLSMIDSEEIETTQVINGSVFFEQLVALCRASTTVEDGVLRYKGISASLAGLGDALVTKFSELLNSNTCVPLEFVPLGKYTHQRQPSLDNRILTLVSLADDIGGPLRDYADALIEGSRQRWLQHNGERNSLASLVKRRNLGTEISDALRDWALEDLDETEDFELAVALLDRHPDSTLREKIEEAFETLVSTEENYILYEADDADNARQAKEDIEAMATRLDLVPLWAEDELWERIDELAGPSSDDFDYDRAREAHAWDRSPKHGTTAEIDELFGTLVESYEDGKEAV